MKLFRYRKPSLNTLLGVTRAKRSVRKALGISAFERYTKPSRVKQRLLSKIGVYNNPTMTVVRAVSKGKAPSPFGIFSRLKLW